MHEFSRTERLIGTEKQQRLADASIAVFGVGGVGSHCVEALARCGVGRLILIDSDVVSLTNINRQSIAVHSTLGLSKVQVMKERIYDIHPGTKVDIFQTFVLPENLEALMTSIGPVDYLIDAIDTVSAKLAIARFAHDKGLSLISSMGTGNKLHGELFEITDISKTSVCPLCRVMRRELKKMGIGHLKVLYSKEPPITPIAALGEDKTLPAGSLRPVPGSISFVPPVAGLLIAGEAVRELLSLP
ncbi:MAG: tRNA threonylcarbamoyladenosine dehydratase [Lachnospiraceae bacterium]|jgi:tRNA A37 threonylcarbamoyladenosine dehydratase|nr:tRNA threonylcarbamoyladenosine dehydratase [Lachnospiraceae bacterium]